MNLQDQLTNLELSRKLEKLGVKQESLWYWCKWNNGDWHMEEKKDFGQFWKNNQFISTFTVAELGKMLPDCSYTEKRGKWYAKSIRAGLMIKPIKAETEADCRAKMLIYLLENGLIKQ